MGRGFEAGAAHPNLRWRSLKVFREITHVIYGMSIIKPRRKEIDEIAVIGLVIKNEPYTTIDFFQSLPTIHTGTQFLFFTRENQSQQN